MSQIVLYTAGEVADLLRLNHQVVQRKLQAGEIPGYRIGREWRVEHSQLRWSGSRSTPNQRRTLSAAEKVLGNFLDDDGRLRLDPHLAGQASGGPRTTWRTSSRPTARIGNAS